MKEKQNSTTTGAAIEQLALAYLSSRGLKELTTNYRCKLGEIDLVMKEGQTVVFVEVRYRRHRLFGGGAASVTRAKQRKLVRAANWYLQQNRVTAPCRFDVVDVCRATAGRNTKDTVCDKLNTGENYHINWISSAFLASD